MRQKQRRRIREDEQRPLLPPPPPSSSSGMPFALGAGTRGLLRPTSPTSPTHPSSHHRLLLGHGRARGACGVHAGRRRGGVGRGGGGVGGRSALVLPLLQHRLGQADEAAHAVPGRTGVVVGEGRGAAGGTVVVMVVVGTGVVLGGRDGARGRGGGGGLVRRRMGDNDGRHPGEEGCGGGGLLAARTPRPGRGPCLCVGVVGGVGELGGRGCLKGGRHEREREGGSNAIAAGRTGPGKGIRGPREGRGRGPQRGCVPWWVGGVGWVGWGGLTLLVEICICSSRRVP